MGLSGWQPAECMAVENELTKWQELGELTAELAAKRCPDGTSLDVVFGDVLCSRQSDMLVHRLKATLERLQRLTQLYVDSLLLVFSERAQCIGAALDLEPERVQVTA